MKLRESQDRTDLSSFCNEWLSAWTGNRPGDLIGFYAVDAYYQDPGRPEGLRGHVEIRPYFEKLLAANPDRAWQAQIPTDNGTVATTGVDIVEVRANKITRNEVYFDPSALKRY